MCLLIFQRCPCLIPLRSMCEDQAVEEDIVVASDSHLSSKAFHMAKESLSWAASKMGLTRGASRIVETLETVNKSIRHSAPHEEKVT